MAACKVCTSPKQGQIDVALLTGESVASVQRAFPEFTDSAIRRHFHNHVSKTLAMKIANVDSFNTADLVQRLIQIANDAQTVRNNAVARNNGSAVLRAINSEIKVISELTQTLGVDTTDVEEFMKDANSLVAALGEAIRENPTIATTVAKHLRDENPAMADILETINLQGEIQCTTIRT